MRLLRTALAVGNAHLRALNSHVSERLGPAKASFGLLTQGEIVCLRRGVSSFGYSGTIAHAVLGGTALPFVARDKAYLSQSPSPLMYERRAFPWRDPPHPFVQHHLPSTDGANIFRSPALGALHALVADHVVQGRVIFPGAGYLELTRAAVPASMVLQSVFFLTPLVIEGDALLVECVVLDGRFEVRSGTSGGVWENAREHCTGTLAAASASWQHIDHASAHAGACACVASVSALYAGFDAIGLQYGPSYRRLACAWGEGDRVAQLRPRSDWQGTVVHPADLDGALQLGALDATGSDGGGARLPFAVDVACLRGVASHAMSMWAAVAQQSGGASLVRLSQLGGRACACLEGFNVRAMVGVAHTRRWHYEVEWSCVPDESASAPARLELLVVGDAQLSIASQSGHNVSQTGSISKDMLPGGRWDGVVFTASLWQGAGERVEEMRVMDIALHMLQAQATLETAPPVWLCTAGTQRAARVSTPPHAGLWGLARTCRQEHMSLPAWCVDVREGGRGVARVVEQHALRVSSGSVRGLQTRASLEPELACGATSLHVPRLVAPYGSQANALDAGFEVIRRALDAHALHAMGAALDMDAHQEAYALLETLCQQYVCDALQNLHEAVVPAWHHKLLYAWCVKQRLAASGHTVTPQEVIAAHPSLWAEVQLVERCAPRLADALSGAVAYQELLFPGGSMEAVLPVYERAAVGTFYNACVVAAVDAVVASLATGRRIVVLEVGAGSGGTASSVLPVLECACSRYVFTDVSDTFLRHARERFSAFSFVEYALLNIDADPRLQGFAAHQCDVVIATNVLHATPFMRNTLRHCAQLLRAGGVLVVNEALRTAAFAQITFGMTDGWWLFAGSGDPERVGQESPLLSWRQWQALLVDSGFHHVHCTQGRTFLRGQAVIVAQTPVSSRPSTCALLGDGAHVISGGLGGLGLLTARLLVEGGARHVVLSSRSGRVMTGSEGDWAWLAESGGDVRRVRSDASDHGSVLAAMRLLCADSLRVAGVFHAAHQLADGAFANQHSLNFRSAYGPKVHGASLLHAALWCFPLRFFNVFSSIAGLRALQRFEPV